MRKMIDISLDANEDVSISNGDFLSEESTQQHQRQLILNEPGEFKENPTACVGAFTYLLNDNMTDLPSAIRRQFAQDGMEVTYIRLADNGKIDTDGYYS